MSPALSTAIRMGIVIFGRKRPARRFQFVRRVDQVDEVVVVHIAPSRILICAFASPRLNRFAFTRLQKKEAPGIAKKVRERKNLGRNGCFRAGCSVELLSEAAESPDDQVNENDGLAMTCWQRVSAVNNSRAARGR